MMTGLTFICKLVVGETECESPTFSHTGVVLGPYTGPTVTRGKNKVTNKSSAETDITILASGLSHRDAISVMLVSSCACRLSRTLVALGG